MKGIIDEIIEENKRFEQEAENLRWQRKNAASLRRAKKRALANRIVITILCLAGAGMLFWMARSVYLTYANHQDYGSQLMDINTHDILYNGAAPIDHYPNIPTLISGRYYLKRSVWYKYWPHELDGRPKQITIVSDHYHGQAIYNNCELSNGYQGIRLTKSDWVTVSSPNDGQSTILTNITRSSTSIKVHHSRRSYPIIALGENIIKKNTVYKFVVEQNCTYDFTTSDLESRALFTFYSDTSLQDILFKLQAWQGGEFDNNWNDGFVPPPAVYYAICDEDVTILVTVKSKAQ